MFSKKCRCGKSTKNFFRDIGPFYIDQCCADAGYNHLGELKEESKEKEVEPGSTLTVADVTAEVKPKRNYNRGGNIKKES